MAAAYLHAGAIGIFGVAVVPAARRRGIASALSVIAARAFPADLAWLHTNDAQARSVYERLGFREVAQWEVWVRGRLTAVGSGPVRGRRILARVTVLGGEPAVPCTRNPLLRG